MFQALFSVQKKCQESISFLVLPQREEFHLEGLSVIAPFPLHFPLIN